MVWFCFVAVSTMQIQIRAAASNGITNTNPIATLLLRHRQEPHSNEVRWLVKPLITYFVTLVRLLNVETATSFIKYDFCTIRFWFWGKKLDKNLKIILCIINCKRLEYTIRLLLFDSPQLSCSCIIDLYKKNEIVSFGEEKLFLFRQANLIDYAIVIPFVVIECGFQ